MALVAVDLPTAEATITALTRLWDAGDAALPVGPALPPAARQALIDAMAPDAIVAHEPGAGAVTRTLPDPAPTDDDIALVVATSGSTAVPKGVELTRAALAASTSASLARLGCADGERWLLCLPLSHVGGIQVLLRARALRTEPEIVDRIDAATVGSTSAAHVSLVPTQLQRLLDAGADVARFEVILLGGARAETGLLDRAAAAGANVVTSYGMTETCGGCVYDGVPLDGVEVDVDADDRVRIRGPVLFSRYRGDPDATAAALDGGWLRTSDVGRIADDRLEVTGRADDVIVTGGHNVEAGEVATILAGTPGVAEVAVVGRDDPEWGQVVVAVVVPAGVPPDLDGLRDVARARLPAHAAPRALVLVDALPRDHMGKVTRQALADLIATR